ncbi:MAG: long-chain fatty acid--CoA ligase [Myxococcales bacterium]|nr:long-chain fatty acid--CoA ligase [Myxococcales bacterium]
MPHEWSHVGSWIERHARERPDRLAVIDAERSLDYASLHERILRCVAVLSARGVGRGDRVALLLKNRSAYLEVIFATARLGAIALPLNARLTAPELRPLLEDADPQLLIHERTLADAVERAAGRLVKLACGGHPDAYERALAEATPQGGLHPVTPEDAMILMYTSGTTGTPKGALLPHRKTLYNSLNAEIFFGLRADDRVLVVLPLFHSFGLLILALPTLFAGGTVELHSHFDAVELWRSVEANRVDFFGGVPVMFQALLGALDEPPARDFDKSSLRFLFTAGAAIPVDVIRGFERHGLVLKQGFGQTETSILCCLDAGDALRKAGSVGRPVHHAEVRIVATDGIEGPTEDWRDVGVGEKGEIVVRGPISMLGYWNRPEATAETLRGEWLRTGDLATADDEGFLTLVGRARHMYISGGENVYPSEVEAVFLEHPDVAEVAIVGVPDERWGESGEAHVVPVSAATLDPDTLLAWARERLAPFKLPRRFHLREALPRTATGKIQKHRL